MSSTPTVLLQAKYLENSETTQYTAPTTCKAVRVDDFTIANRSGAAVTIIVRAVPSGGTAGVEHEVVPSKTLAAGDVYLVEPMWLAPGDFIRTTAGAATSLVARIGGRVIA